METVERPQTMRDRVRRRVLTTVLGRFDNRENIRRATTLDAHQATANQGNGPYHVPGSPLRRDIREGRVGAPLLLRIRAVEVGTLAAVAGAAVEVWHCDAEGIYSGYQRYGADRFPALVSLSLRRFRPTDTATFLRGQQVTDPDGYVEFQTIVPGWYTPRTVHIHVRISIGETALLGTELYFPDDFATHVQSLPPYAKRGRSPFVNAHDIEIRMAKGSPGSWPTIRPTADGHRADVTLQIRH
ncbi:hypothetical protein AB0J90_26635 [Micromonospora sp. NPDC049523]|uniref:dioxygenase family protein n=1 Tax=Micromonospora sp. NPDC049523 TaxID=3155921 RepID=UPI0034498D99